MYRCFFTTPEIYEEIRQRVNADQGFPNYIATTCIPLVEDLFIDAIGNCHICIDIDYVVEAFLNTNGVVEEI